VGEAVHGSKKREGLEMTGRITLADIAQAKEELAARHAAILARHANEIRGLDADEAEIDELAGLVEAFTRKFKAPAAVPEILAARPREQRVYRQVAPLKVAGFDRAMVPAEIYRRVPPSGAVAIDFHR
jgi:hypothetical protein